MSKNPETVTNPKPFSKMRKCGEDFEKSIPAGSGKDNGSEMFDKNHWKVVFDAYREEDEKQCDLWKDEAGLFSAVVTAFLIESYKFLLPQGGSDPSKFGPDHGHVVRLNSLWFCSLVLALSTVVIGIVALQWIRNHQRYHGIKPRDALSVYEMRTKALREWHVRWAFLSLPLLILVALVLFFVGLVDFLLTLNKKVAAPVGILVYATLTILFITTVLPSLQIFWLYFRRPHVELEAEMPTPCPYKSPQSWIFHRSLILSIRGFRRVKRWLLRQKQAAVDMVSRADMPLYLTFYASPKKWTDYDTKWLRLRDMYSQTMEGNYEQKQAHFSSVSLLHPRRPIFDEAQILRQTISTFNPSADVLFAAYHCFREISKNALYQEIESNDDYADPKYDERNKILRGYYWKHITLSAKDTNQPRFGPPIFDLIPNPDAHLLHDENMLVFLQMHTSHNLPDEASRVISAHLCELQARILAYTYTPQPALHIQLPNAGHEKSESETAGSGEKPATKDLTFEWLRMMSQQYIDMVNSTSALPKFKVWSQFASSSLNGNDISVSTDTINDAITQFSMLSERFVRCIKKPESLDWEGTFYAHKNIAQLWKVPATMLRYRGTDQSPFDAFSQFDGVFDLIQAALASPNRSAGAHTAQDSEINEAGIQEAPTSPSELTDNDGPVQHIGRKNADYLFLSACLFLEHLFNPYAELPLKEFNQDQCRRMADFLKVVDAYEGANGALLRIKRNYDTLWTKTGLPDKPRFKFTAKPNIKSVAAWRTSGGQSYIRWKDIPLWIDVDFAIDAAPIHSPKRA